MEVTFIEAQYLLKSLVGHEAIAAGNGDIWAILQFFQNFVETYPIFVIN